MNERGQLFTLDMLFALMLTALVVSYSGLALDHVRRQAEAYTLRYTLERTANDAADTLAKTFGRPWNWEKNVSMLEVLGLAEMDEFTGKALQNQLSVAKLGELKILCMSSNWNPSKPEVKAVTDFFGTSNFRLRVIDATTENVIWDIWPRWDVGEAGVKNSLEVAVVRRTVAAKYGDIEVDSGQLSGATGQTHTVWFEILPGELDVYDWYIIARTGDDTSQQIDTACIFVNRLPNTFGDYSFQVSNGVEQTFPRIHGGVRADQTVENNLHEGWNFLNIKVVNGGPEAWIEVYVMRVPACTPPGIVNLDVAQRGLPAAFELNLWR
jgi:hypothetical protein